MRCERPKTSPAGYSAQPHGGAGATAAWGSLSDLTFLSHSFLSYFLVVSVGLPIQHTVSTSFASMYRVPVSVSLMPILFGHQVLGICFLNVYFAPCP